MFSIMTHWLYHILPNCYPLSKTESCVKMPAVSERKPIVLVKKVLGWICAKCGRIVHGEHPGQCVCRSDEFYRKVGEVQCYACGKIIDLAAPAKSTKTCPLCKIQLPPLKILDF